MRPSIVIEARHERAQREGALDEARVRDDKAVALHREAFDPQDVEVNGALFRADICAVTGNFYSELGAQPELGRLLTPGDVNLSSRANSGSIC